MVGESSAMFESMFERLFRQLANWSEPEDDRGDLRDVFIIQIRER